MTSISIFKYGECLFTTKGYEEEKIETLKEIFYEKFPIDEGYGYIFIKNEKD